MELGIIKCTRADLAFIIAGLVREGITFEANESQYGFTITLTGGF